VIIGTAHGMSIRFAVSDARPMGRGSSGVKGIDLREGDHVIGMDAVEDEDRQQVLTICAKGYGKRTPLMTRDDDGEPISDKSFKIQRRGGLGLVAIQTSERNGDLTRLRLVEPDEGVMVITNGGQVIRTRVDEIRETGRNTQGVIVIRLREGERVVDIEPVPREEADNLEDAEAVEGEGGEEGAEGSAAAEPGETAPESDATSSETDAETAEEPSED
jgi:DNA gyrase subunit A